MTTANGVMLILTAAQARMARVALKLGVRDVATGAGVATSTVVRLEGGQGVRRDSLNKIVAFYQSKGIEFINGDGPGVRLRQKERP